MQGAAAWAEGKVPRAEGSHRSRGPMGLLRVLARRMEQEHSAKTLHREPEYIERQIGRVRAYTRYFSPEVRGKEFLPAEGPALLIGNHNGLC